MWSMADTQLAQHILMANVLSRDEAIYHTKAKQYLNRLKDEFEAMFGVLPLVNFSSIFVESAGFILSISHDRHLMFDRFWFYGINVLSTFFVVIVVNNIQAREKKRNQLIVANSWEQLAEKDLTAGLRLRETFCHYTPLTAIFFQIDLSLILPFVGTLVSFTVMLVQLQYDH
ncbi:hypothetical protein HDE_06930 [Halotydeus destructor]|nr:hypothetical protein HDE_06930 [Halotydeus destructor]